jgi:superfamily II DNA or RNA helicase
LTFNEIKRNLILIDCKNHRKSEMAKGIFIFPYLIKFNLFKMMDKNMTYEKYLIEKRLVDLKQHDYNIVVLKGFTFEIYELLSQDHKKIEPENIFNYKKLINLEVLTDELRNIISTIFTLDKEYRYVMLYETLLMINKSLDISISKLDFIVVENNFLDYFPNLTNLKLEETEDFVNEDFNDGNSYDLFSQCININGKQYIKYMENVDVILKGAKIINIVNESTENNIVTYLKDDINDNIEVISFNDEKKYNELMIKLFYSTEIMVTNFLTDVTMLNNKKVKEKLKKIKGFFNEIGQEPVIYSYTNELKTEFRPIFFEYLNKYWGSDKFRVFQFYKNPGVNFELIDISQVEILENIINQCEKGQQKKGDVQDIFLTASTGAGKSLLYQLPAIFLAENYNCITIIITPLLALMKDQTNSLKKRGYEKVVALNSELTFNERKQEIEKIQKGETNIIYLSPELIINTNIKTIIGDRYIGLIVIDEAHLVSTWGRNFRVDYWYLGNFLKITRKNSNFYFPILALTATAVFDPSGINDMVFETINMLKLNNPIKYIGKVRRDNIKFIINKPTYSSDYEKEKKLIAAEKINNFCKKNEKTIVYFPYINQIKLLKELTDKNYKDKICEYYSSIDGAEKEDVYNSFKDGNSIVMLASKAFGMGVDIEDIKNVYHYAPSGLFVDYVQEIGRLARKEDITGYAIIDFSRKDLIYSSILFSLSSIKHFQIKMVLEKLNKLYKYHKKKNILVSINDFEYIFKRNSSSINTLVKSALLYLENDLLLKFGYNLISVRPKTILTSVFFSVKNDFSYDLENNYKKYLEEKNDQTFPKNDFKVYTFNLEKLWIEKFNDESFPSVKDKFYSGKLFSDILVDYHPLIRISYFIYGDLDETLGKISNYFAKIKKCLFSFDGMIKETELINVLKSEFNNTSLVRRIYNLIVNQFAAPEVNFNIVNRKTSPDYFFNVRRTKNETSYFLIPNSCESVFTNLIGLFEKNFSNSQKINLYLPNHTIDEYGKNYFRIAYILETFNLGTYNIQGGETPAISINFIDPKKIELLAKSNYENDLLKTINKRFEISQKIFVKFFETDMTDTERWDFIEKFFLGVPYTELLEK